MARKPKRTKAPPKRVWVVFDVHEMTPEVVVLTEEDALPLEEGEVIYRYDLHGGQK